MPSPPAPRPRLNRQSVTAAAAAAAVVVVAAALAIAPLRGQPDGDLLRPLTTVLAALGAGTTIVALLGRKPSWGMVAAGVFGAELVSTLYDHPARVDAGAPLTAAGLLLLCELVAWSAETRDGAVVIPAAGRQLPKPALLVFVAVAAWAATTALAVLATVVAVGRDLAVAAVGGIAVAGLAATLVVATRRSA